jgi:hypothetical protein
MQRRQQPADRSRQPRIVANVVFKVYRLTRLKFASDLLGEFGKCGVHDALGRV